MSSLGWIDFDEAERQRVQRIIALFQERESRDELGLGAIRNSIVDHLFRSTSAIQTRLRYMLFIPWLYRVLEKREVPEAQILTEARHRNPACQRLEGRRASPTASSAVMRDHDSSGCRSQSGQSLDPGIVETLKNLATLKERERFSKETYFSARRTESRLARKNERSNLTDEDEDELFLRRKMAQGQPPPLRPRQ